MDRDTHYQLKEATRDTGHVSPRSQLGHDTGWTGTMAGVTTDQPGKIKPGDIYEDCSFHPVLCTYINDGDEIGGISLIDASSPRACSLSGCGVIKLSIADVITARAGWPAYQARRKEELAAEQDPTKA